MEVAFGVLRWSPDQFWLATPIELRSAHRGWQRAQGVDPDAVGKPGQPQHILSREVVVDLKKLMDSTPDSFVRSPDGS